MLNWTQTSGKNQNSYGDVNDQIAKQQPLLKSHNEKKIGGEGAGMRYNLSIFVQGREDSWR